MAFLKRIYGAWLFNHRFCCLTKPLKVCIVLATACKNNPCQAVIIRDRSCQHLLWRWLLLPRAGLAHPCLTYHTSYHRTLSFRLCFKWGSFLGSMQLTLRDFFFSSSYWSCLQFCYIFLLLMQYFKNRGGNPLGVKF